jgi:hypothetical protein
MVFARSSITLRTVGPVEGERVREERERERECGPHFFNSLKKCCNL